MTSSLGNLQILTDDIEENETIPDKDCWIVAKEYKDEKALCVEYFHHKELTNLKHCRVSKTPTTGRVKKITIECKEKQKIEVLQHINTAIDDRISGLLSEIVTVDRNNSQQLTKFLSQHERDEGVLYIPHHTKGLFKIYSEDKQTLQKAYKDAQHEVGVSNNGTSYWEGTSRRGSDTNRTVTDRSKDVKRSYADAARPSEHSVRDGNSGLLRSSGAFGGADADDAYEPMDTSEPSPAPSGCHTTSLDRLTLKIYNASILHLKVDAIVNAANEGLAHGGGVAYVIAEAAGPRLNAHCRRYLSESDYGCVPVTRNMVSTAGDLNYKGVIHAVGPTWWSYRNKAECLEDLYRCVYNVLVTCEHNGFRTVGMPAISSGIFGVPKARCADMYVKAAADYGRDMRAGAHLAELHIIDVNTEILDLVKDSVARYLDDPNSIDHQLPHYINRYPEMTSSSSSRRSSRSARHRPPPLPCKVTLAKEESLNEGSSKRGGNDTQFKLEFELANRFKVLIFKGDIIKATADAIVCGVRFDSGDITSTGFIADAIRKAGGRKYEDEFRAKKNKLKFQDRTRTVFKCKAGGYLFVDHIIHVMLKQILDASEEEVKAYERSITDVLQFADEKKCKNILLPLVGTGRIYTNEDKLNKCIRVLLRVLCEFSTGKVKHLKEVQLVNNNDHVTKILGDIFKTASYEGDSRNNKPEADSFPKGNLKGMTKIINTERSAAGNRDRNAGGNGDRNTPGRSSGKPDQREREGQGTTCRKRNPRNDPLPNIPKTNANKLDIENKYDAADYEGDNYEEVMSHTELCDDKKGNGYKKDDSYNRHDKETDRDRFSNDGVKPDTRIDGSRDRSVVDEDGDLHDNATTKPSGNLMILD